MAVSTANTILKYASTCNAQVETLTITGTITTAGNATVVVTSKELVGSPVTLSVAVALSDTATNIATKVRTALNANVEIPKVFTIGGTGASVILTRKYPTCNDSTLNISIADGTCVGITAVPISTNTTAGGTFTKLVDILSYPDMGSAPSKLDTTSLTEDSFKTSTLGLQETPDLTFEANYDESVLDAINALTASNYYLQLDFGGEGKFDWQGQIKAYTNGGGVDEVRKMTIVLSASTPINFAILN